MAASGGVPHGQIGGESRLNRKGIQNKSKRKVRQSSYASSRLQGAVWQYPGGALGAFLLGQIDNKSILKGKILNKSKNKSRINHKNHTVSIA
jgi:hypothetical protein